MSLTMSDSEATLQFEAYYEEFTRLFEQITTSTTDATTTSDNNNAQQEALFRQCHEILQQLAVEARDVDDSLTKRDLLQRVKHEKSRLTALEHEHEKQTLVTGAASAVSGGNSAQHQQLHENEVAMARQNETLERARRTMQETEAVGMEVTHELGQNRAKIESTTGRVGELTSLTDQASGLLKSMSKPWWRR
jgi:short-subunit dehydrogenase involved in D-alanine esterification of teichoic acids